MRKLLLTAALVALIVAPAVAQRRGGGRGGRGMFGGGMMTGDMLLLNKSVQEELKLTDKQKGEAAKVQKAQRERFQKVREAFQEGDQDKARELGEKARKETEKDLKKVKEGLNTDQAKRFKQIQIQVAGLEALKRKDVQEELKLTDKQKEEIKEAEEDVRKDAAEIFKEAGRGGFGKAMEKVNKVRKDALNKVTKTFTDEQKKTWKEMTGKPFVLKMEGFGPRGPRGGPPTDK
jgi:membrane protein involved in colicin uptake